MMKMNEVKGLKDTEEAKKQTPTNTAEKDAFRDRSLYRAISKPRSKCQTYHELKDEEKLVILTDDLLQLHHVRMVQLPQRLQG